ncbi:MAG: AAA family ATPase, partial [Clostridia bacterium]|nr:AAA family ATPase [Clostridia bacterium]
TMMDMKTNKEVSFRDTIIFITTNAGSSLYDDPTVVDLSHVSRSTILEALRTDIKPGTNDEPFFPACITTRFANGHVILFNHLEPFSLMQIVRSELEKQIGFFRDAYGVEVAYDPDQLAALVLYSTGGTADARSLRGTAKNMIVKELQDVVMQAYRSAGDGVNQLKHVTITVEPDRCEQEVKTLFEGHGAAQVPVFADPYVIDRLRPVIDGADAQYDYFSDPDGMKRRARGVVDYILLDPLAGARTMERIPNDIEDVDAEGMDLFRYLKEYYPDVPVYFLDVRGKGSAAFATLLANGGRGVVEFDPEAPEKVREQLETLSFSALVNNNTFQLGRSGKYLSYNCSQYTVDESTVAVAFDQLSLSYATASSDDGVITKTGDKNGVTFDDVIGCKEAKKELQGFCKFVADPRQLLLEGKKVPRGVLLYGPPGTGKTMLAKALANEAKAAFLPLTATTLFGSLVGESERNVRELFRRARRYAPSGIFIDEVDAIARARTGSVSTSHNEDTLNAFIAEMDGFSTDDRRPVFVLAATNYQVSGDGPRVLDPAFVRRFDRKIYVDLPDAEDRFRLLQLTLSRHGVDFGPDHEAIVRNLAERSSGMSNADLTVVVDMFLRACEDKEATGAELMEALNSFRFGEVNELDPAFLRETACHEAGHALVARLLGETPAFLTVVSRDNFGGFMEYSHDEKKPTSTYGELMNRVCTALAGRAAEIEVYGKDAGLNTGASSDITNARHLIKRALNDFAMGDKLYTAGTDEDCEKLMQEQFARTAQMISDHRAVLNALTDLLCARKSLDKTELEVFFRKNL